MMRRVIVLLVAMLLASAALLAAIERLGPRGAAVDGVAPNSVLALELVSDAAAFERLLRTFWVAPRAGSAQTEAGAPEPPIPRLRWSLLVDSLLLVPAYGALLVIGLLMMYRRLPTHRPRRINFWLHALCALPVLATVFDIAENGMLARAAEDALAGLLADATVADMRDASDIKWGWIALASLVSGAVALMVWLVQRQRPMPHAWTLPAAAAFGLATCALLLPGLPWRSPALVQAGALSFGVLLLLTARNAWALDGADAETEAATQR